MQTPIRSLELSLSQTIFVFVPNNLLAYPHQGSGYRELTVFVKWYHKMYTY